jgi:mono/diheme cytochrome c family protein
LHCQGCHLVDGRETPGKIPALVGAGRFLSVTGGREFLVRVPGVSLSVLDDAELAELVNWMLYRFSAKDMTGDFPPYTAEEVARYRRNPLVDVETVRRELVAAFE